MSDEERDLRKYSRRSAIGLMGVGGGLAATETLGFTNLTADRGVNGAVADDLDAALKIEVADSAMGSNGNGEELEGEFTNEVFIRFENNTGDHREIDLGGNNGEISGDDSDKITVSDETNGDLNVDSPSFDFTLSDNEDFVEIKVAENGTSEDKLDDLTLELNNVDIGGATVTLTRDFEIDVTSD